MNSSCLSMGLPSLRVRTMKTSESDRDVFGWQPGQNLAFLIITSAMIVGGVLALLL